MVFLSVMSSRSLIGMEFLRIAEVTRVKMFVL